MRTSSYDNNVAPPWPPPCSSPCPSPLLEMTADDHLASFLCRIDECNAPKPPHLCPLQAFWEQHHQFLLSSVLHELRLTVCHTPPVLMRTALPPPTCAKYAFVTSYLSIQEGLGPVLLYPATFAHCALSLPGQQHPPCPPPAPDYPHAVQGP
eukprot:14824890-Ditylum_brightwellii.AAC.1